MKVSFGTTKLDRARQGEAGDGIASYVRALHGALGLHGDVSLQDFRFGAKGERSSWGHFSLQAQWSWITGREFFMAGNSARRAGAEVVHAPDHLLPKINEVPVVATIFDAIPLSHPADVGFKWRRYKTAFWKHSARWATRIITISEHSKREIAKWFELPEEIITVTPLGVEEKWSEEVGESELERVREKYRLPPKFFLFVGTLQPRKNVRRIIEAHKKLPPPMRRDFPLIIAGRHGWKCEAEVDELQSCPGGTMRWIQYVPAADLLPICKQATALVWPSLNEGFGLPVLEAFAAGLPVVTSTTTSLPEVAGDAALLVDPVNLGEITEAMRQIAGNDALRAELRMRGQARAKQFTWDRTASLTIDVYRQAIEEFRGG